MSFSIDEPDVLYVNGNIYMVDEKFSKASVIAVKSDKIIYVGSDIGITKSASAKVIDLGGKTVIPGLIEGHMHFSMLGAAALQIDAFYQPKETILSRVAQRSRLAENGEWITGRGWNNEAWSDVQWPTKEDLDAVSPEHPVVLGRVDGHSVWVNSKALEAAGITCETPNPQGGELLRNAEGEILGILTDTAMDTILKKIPPFTDVKKRESYMLAQKELFSFGITSLFDAGVTFEETEFMKALYKYGDLQIRVYALLEAAANADLEYIKAGYIPTMELFDNRLSINAVKIYADGSLGSRSALLLEDYSDRPGHRGNSRYTEEELYELVKRAHNNGFQISSHAIGDGAVNMVLNAYERVLSEAPRYDHRYRIEHFQIATPDDIIRSVKMGVIAAMQPTHATSDMYMAEQRVGSKRIKSSFAWRSIINNGGIIVGGSDAPIELVNPFHGIFASITRTDKNCKPYGGWYPEQALTREEALRAFTIWAAKGQFEEDIKGSIEPGKLADFAVLDRDIMTCRPIDIYHTRVIMTVVGGKLVYGDNL